MSALRTSLTLTLALVLTVGSVAQARRVVDERQLKAATIVSMLRLVTWRPAPSSPAIGVLVVGDSALADALRGASASQRVGGRSVVVSAIPTLSGLPEALPPVIVLAGTQRGAARALARAVRQQPVLTIGDGNGMGDAGLVIGIYVDGERIRFDANTGAASRAGLFLSSHLLRLARIVG